MNSMDQQVIVQLSEWLGADPGISVRFAEDM